MTPEPTPPPTWPTLEQAFVRTMQIREASLRLYIATLEKRVQELEAEKAVRNGWFW
jgi:hypothetical protein